MISSPPLPPPLQRTAIAAASALLDAVSGTIRMASALALANRQIDLSGLDQEIGRICAAALDLDVEDGRALRSRLIGLLAELDQLAENFAER